MISAILHPLNWYAGWLRLLAGFISGMLNVLVAIAAPAGGPAPRIAH